MASLSKASSGSTRGYAAGDVTTGLGSPDHDAKLVRH